MAQVSNASEAMALIEKEFDPSKVPGVSGSIQLDLSGEGGGQWGLKIADGNCEVVEGEVESPDTKIMMSAEDFVSMVNGELNAMAAFMQGKIKMEGDMGMAMKLQALLDVG